ncbi:methyltransferase domain-containing protein [Pavlovales sp. CCMP2436]|nr:methyltransferase domain-containing protein [Pavlovales sp. CCMP2436]
MHEIPRMARCVQWLALASDRPVQVLDVGSGKGYLGSFLSVACGIRTVSVEGSHMIAAGAVRRHANLSRLFRGREAGHELRVAWLSKTAADGESFAASSRQDGATAAQEKDEAAQRTILTGLHACGDLTSTAVAAFVQRPELWGLVAVGCCYNMMAPETFPVSGHLRRSGLTLSRALRMLALKSLEREAGQQPAEGGEPALTSARTLWRPLLNLLLRDELGVDVRARSEELSVGRRASKSESWPVYARSALSHLGFEPSSVPNETALRELEVRCVGTSLERVLKLEVLRLMLAAAVESLIALDRLLSVLESGQCAAAWIVRVFEPSESPRCLGIVCRRC